MDGKTHNHQRVDQSETVGDDAGEEPRILPFPHGGAGVRGRARETLALSPVEQRLKERRDAREISLFDFDSVAVRIIYETPGRVIQKSDLEGVDGKLRPLVLSAQDVEDFRQIDYIGPGGKSCTIDPEMVKDGVLILFPEEFGNGEWTDE